jgi:hypothetical protein
VSDSSGIQLSSPFNIMFFNNPERKVLVLQQEVMKEQAHLTINETSLSFSFSLLDLKYK